MRIYPAIDIISGQAVRLARGDYSKMTRYSDNPAEVAKKFEAQGAEYIHIVDLDGAKAKKPMNTEAIKAIASSAVVPLQVGGGIRSVESAEQLLKYADRVIIGTLALAQPDILSELIDKFGPNKIVVSVDYKDGRPAVNGWLETTNIDTGRLQSRLLRQGVRTVIITDVSKDGLMSGPNIGLMKQWKQAGFEVICAGGVTTPQDIEQLSSANIDGAIIGKALYEGKITLKEALSVS